MNDKPYQKECMYCKNKIIMSKESGAWLPYDLNNGQHDCRKKQDTPKQTNESLHETKNELSLEIVLRKLKNIGITIDLDILRNATNGATK